MVANMHIIDHKKLAQSILEKLEVCSAEAGLKDKGERLKQEVAPLIERHTPSIMFYGVYNSGKSSVINGIVGKEIAETGDIPTTVKTQQINWGGFNLTDTPGIEADEDHTRIAENELKRQDVVLFVVEDGSSFDTNIVTAEILRIIEMKKPLIVVVNEKNPTDIDMDKGSIVRIKEKLVDNVRKGARSRNIKGVERKFTVQAVNALSAFTAKQLLKAEPDNELALELLESSKIGWLEAEIRDVLDDVQGIRQLITPVNIMAKYTRGIQKILNARVESFEEKAYLEKIQDIKEQKNILYQNVVSKGHLEIGQAGDTIFVLLSKGESVNAITAELTDRLRSIVEGEFSKASLLLHESLSFGQLNMSEKLQLEKITFAIPALESVTAGDTIDDLTKLVGTIATGPKEPFYIIVVFANYIVKIMADKKKVEEENERLRAQIAEQNQQMQEGLNKQIVQIMELNTRIRREMQRFEDNFAQTIKNHLGKYYEHILQEIDQVYATEKQATMELRDITNKLENIASDITEFLTRLND